MLSLICRLIQFRLLLILVGFCICFAAGHYTTLPRCRGVSREVVKLIRQFESDKAEGILLVVFGTDGRQMFYYSKNSAETPKLEEVIHGANAHTNK